ncbi:MAG: RrF2 family transcriptional regulator [Mycobacteriaceae bacterium]
MQLSKFTDIGLRIVMRLAVVQNDEQLTAAGIAEQMNISYTHTAKVSARLQNLGVVVAARGRSGGMSISALGRKASIGWLVRELEGEGEVVTCEGKTPCPLTLSCRLRGSLRQAQEAFFSSLDDLTVEDLAAPPVRAVLLELKSVSTGGIDVISQVS